MWEPEQPSLMSIVNVMFITPSNCKPLSLSPYLYCWRIYTFALFQYGFVHVLLSENIHPAITGNDIFIPNTVAMQKAFSLGSELLITALLTLAGLNHVAKRLQFLKQWLRRLLWWENLPYGAQHFLESIYNYYVQCWWHRFYSSSQCSMFASVHPLALKY